MKLSAILPACVAFSWQTVAAAPKPPADLVVTDVTAKSFRAIWHSDPETEPEIEVFSDAGGTIPVNGLIVTPFPHTANDDLLKIESAERGLLSIEVSGLSPDTTYRFRARSRSMVDDSATGGTLQQVKTATQAGLISHSIPFSAITNPMIRFEGLTGNGESADVSALVVASVPGARSPVTTVVGFDGVVWIDLNNLISDTGGTAMPVSGGEPLTIRMYRGHNKPVEHFGFFAPAGNSDAGSKNPRIVPGSLTGNVSRAHLHEMKPSRVFMEFPVVPGDYYNIECSETLAPGSWTVAATGLRAEDGRLFWEDNGLAGTPTPPKDTPKRFYRAVPVTP